MTERTDGAAGTLPGKAPAARRRRRGQTTVEYLLVTVSLFVVFAIMFKALSYALANQFKRGAMVIVKMYKVDPW